MLYSSQLTISNSPNYKIDVDVYSQSRQNYQFMNGFAILALISLYIVTWLGCIIFH